MIHPALRLHTGYARPQRGTDRHSQDARGAARLRAPPRAPGAERTAAFSDIQASLWRLPASHHWRSEVTISLPRPSRRCQIALPIPAPSSLAWRLATLAMRSYRCRC
ncbi:hypothetical protein AAFF_G00042420 [Aldrovandia affinis]|uniref:Uncharacterized protein n=1 Tax=Aldrovandia affinis TaxID=143900 RepID=A0AAD7WF85_9TELE|nr:hypothetical protein AAFF_G00042420 [Aldrovandia affinis]